jgi:hypothetical protein
LAVKQIMKKDYAVIAVRGEFLKSDHLAVRSLLAITGLTIAELTWQHRGEVLIMLGGLSSVDAYHG